MTLTPYIRNYNYIADYYYTVYQYYTSCYIGYPVNYYSIDWNNSIFDSNLEAGSYEKGGVGKLSGMKWNKIMLLPVYGIESIQPGHTADEKGLTLTESERSGLAFPTTYGIKPCEWDVVHFHQEFMTPDTPHDIQPIFIVHNVNLATHGNLTHYQIKLKVAPYRRDQLEKQISNYFMFLDFTKKIHRIDTASILLRLEKKSGSLSNILQDNFNKIGFYLQKKEV